MALPVDKPLNQAYPTAYTPSVGASPIAAYFRAPFRGTVRKLAIILGGAITTANMTLTVQNVTQGVTIGTVTVPFTGSAAGSITTADLSSGFPASLAASQINEDDVISVTPSGASGATIPAEIQLELRAG